MNTDPTTKATAVILAMLATVYAVVFWSSPGQALFIAGMFWVLIALTLFVAFRVKRSPVLVATSLVLAVAALLPTIPAALVWTAWSFGGMAP